MEWYQNSYWNYFILIVFFAVGLYRLWKHSKWAKSAKVVTTILMLVIAILLLVNVLGNASSATPVPTLRTVTAAVYITDTGSKYHRDGCRYLKYSEIAISKTDAIAQGYAACKVCDP